MNNFSSEPVKRIYRSKYDRMISGVCGGIGEYFSIDVLLVRILWIVITLFGGVGILLYIAAVIIVPENPGHLESETDSPKKKNDKTFFWGALLIIVGIALIFKQMGLFHYLQIWNVPWQMIWAIILISLGAFLMFNKNKSQDDESVKETFAPGKEEDPNSKQIYRSRTDKMLAGVCGGLADYFHLDPTIVRLLYVVLSLASVGIGIVIYIVMMLVFPEKPFDDSENTTTSGDVVK